MGFLPLTWTNFRNTDAYPKRNDLRKISGVEGEWDADAVSVEQIASAVEGYGITFTLEPETNYETFCGLSHDNPSAHWSTIDFCIDLFAGERPIVFIYENGVERLMVHPFLHANFKIIINALGQIEYWETDTPSLLYTSLVAPTFPLFADASLCFYRTEIVDALIDAGVVAKIDHLPLMGVH